MAGLSAPHAVVVAVAVTVAANLAPSLPGEPSTQLAQGADEEIPACGKRQKLYTLPPLDLDDVAHIIPLGNVSPTAHTFPTAHLYWHIRRTVPGDPSSPTVSAPVVAPGEVWVTSISSSENLDRGTLDYSMRFSPCAEHRAYFIHLTTLDSRLAAQMTEPLRCNEYVTGGERWRQCTKDLSLAMAAGDPVGTAGGAADRNALDFGAADYRVEPAVYANADRWAERPDQLALVCALDYYARATRKRLRALLGDGTTRRVDRPRCGQVAQDVPGSLQGVWFLAGTEGLAPEDDHLALVHDNVDPDRGVFSVGNSVRRSGLDPATYYFDPVRTGEVNRDFDRVRKRGRVYCYETSRRFAQPTDPATVILAALIDRSTLRLEGTSLEACGRGPWEMSGKHTEFER